MEDLLAPITPQEAIPEPTLTQKKAVETEIAVKKKQAEANGGNPPSNEYVPTEGYHIPEGTQHAPVNGPERDQFMLDQSAENVFAARAQNQQTLDDSYVDERNSRAVMLDQDPDSNVVFQDDTLLGGIANNSLAMGVGAAKLVSNIAQGANEIYTGLTTDNASQADYEQHARISETLGKIEAFDEAAGKGDVLQRRAAKRQADALRATLSQDDRAFIDNKEYENVQELKDSFIRGGSIDSFGKYLDSYVDKDKQNRLSENIGATIAENADEFEAGWNEGGLSGIKKMMSSAASIAGDTLKHGAEDFGGVQQYIADSLAQMAALTVGGPAGLALKAVTAVSSGGRNQYENYANWMKENPGKMPTKEEAQGIALWSVGQTALELMGDRALAGAGSRTMGTLKNAVTKGATNTAKKGRARIVAGVAGKVTGRVAAESAQEFIQEGSENLASQMAVKQDVSKIDVKEAAKSATIGALTGGAMTAGGKQLVTAPTDAPIALAKYAAGKRSDKKAKAGKTKAESETFGKSDSVEGLSTGATRMENAAKSDTNAEETKRAAGEIIIETADRMQALAEKENLTDQDKADLEVLQETYAKAKKVWDKPIGSASADENAFYKEEEYTDDEVNAANKERGQAARDADAAMLQAKAEAEKETAKFSKIKKTEEHQEIADRHDKAVKEQDSIVKVIEGIKAKRDELNAAETLIDTTSQEQEKIVKAQQAREAVVTAMAGIQTKLDAANVVNSANPSTAAQALVNRLEGQYKQENTKLNEHATPEAMAAELADLDSQREAAIEDLTAIQGKSQLGYGAELDTALAKEDAKLAVSNTGYTAVDTELSNYLKNNKKTKKPYVKYRAAKDKFDAAVKAREEAILEYAKGKDFTKESLKKARQARMFLKGIDTVVSNKKDSTSANLMKILRGSRAQMDPETQQLFDEYTNDRPLPGTRPDKTVTDVNNEIMSGGKEGFRGLETYVSLISGHLQDGNIVLAEVLFRRLNNWINTQDQKIKSGKYTTGKKGDINESDLATMRDERDAMILVRQTLLNQAKILFPDAELAVVKGTKGKAHIAEVLRKQGLQSSQGAHTINFTKKAKIVGILASLVYSKNADPQFDRYKAAANANPNAPRNITNERSEDILSDLTFLENGKDKDWSSLTPAEQKAYSDAKERVNRYYIDALSFFKSNQGALQTVVVQAAVVSAKPRNRKKGSKKQTQEEAEEAVTKGTNKLFEAPISDLDKNNVPKPQVGLGYVPPASIVVVTSEAKNRYETMLNALKTYIEEQRNSPNYSPQVEQNVQELEHKYLNVDSGDSNFVEVYNDLVKVVNTKKLKWKDGMRLTSGDTAPVGFTPNNRTVEQALDTGTDFSAELGTKRASAWQTVESKPRSLKTNKAGTVSAELNDKSVLGLFHTENNLFGMLLNDPTSKEFAALTQNLSEEQITSVTEIANFVNKSVVAMKTTIVKPKDHRGIASNGEAKTENDILYDLFPDGKMPQVFQEAVGLALASFMQSSARGTLLNDNDTIAKFFGFKKDITTSDRARAALAQNGIPEGVLVQALGEEMARVLALRQKPNGRENEYKQLITGLGQLVLRNGDNFGQKGLFSRKYAFVTVGSQGKKDIPSNNVELFQDKMFDTPAKATKASLDAKAARKADQKKNNSATSSVRAPQNNYTVFVKVRESAKQSIPKLDVNGKPERVSTRLASDVESIIVAMSSNVVQKFLGIETSFKPVYHTIEELPPITGTHSSQFQKESITKLQETPHEFDEDYIGVIAGFTERGIIELSDSYPEEGTEHVNNRELYSQGRDESLQAYANLLQMRSEFQNNPDATGVYFTHSINASNKRMNQQGGYGTPMSTNLVRWGLKPAHFKVTLDKNDATHMLAFKMAVLEGLDKDVLNHITGKEHGVDKSLDSFIATQFASIIDADTELTALMDAIALSGLAEAAPLIEEYIGYKGVKIPNATSGSAHKLDAIIAYSKYLESETLGLTSFEVNSGKENDGITNGIAIALTQYAAANNLEDYNTRLNRVGMSMGHVYPTFAAFASQPGSQDAYEDTADHSSEAVNNPNYGQGRHGDQDIVSVALGGDIRYNAVTLQSQREVDPSKQTNYKIRINGRLVPYDRKKHGDVLEDETGTYVSTKNIPSATAGKKPKGGYQSSRKGVGKKSTFRRKANKLKRRLSFRTKDRTTANEVRYEVEATTAYAMITAPHRDINDPTEREGREIPRVVYDSFTKTSSLNVTMGEYNGMKNGINLLLGSGMVNKEGGLKRNFMKGPLMTKMYGAGIIALKRALGGAAYHGITAQIEAANKIADPDAREARFVEIEVAVNSLSPITRMENQYNSNGKIVGEPTPVAPFEINRDYPLETEVVAKLEKDIAVAIEFTHGAALDVTFKSKYAAHERAAGQMAEMSRVIVAMSAEIWNKAVADKLTETGNSSLTSYELQTLKTELEPELPYLKTLLAEQGNYAEGIDMAGSDKTVDKGINGETLDEDTSVTNVLGVRKDKDGKTSQKLRHNTYSRNKFADPGVSVNAISIQALDAAVVTILAGADAQFTNIHDAGIFNLLDVFNDTTTMNEAFSNTFSNYNIPREMHTTFERILRSDKFTPEMRTSIEEQFKSGISRTVGGTSLNDALLNLDNIASVAEHNVKLLARMGMSISQYSGGSDGVYRLEAEGSPLSMAEAMELWQVAEVFEDGIAQDRIQSGYHRILKEAAPSKNDVAEKKVTKKARQRRIKKDKVKFVEGTHFIGTGKVNTLTSLYHGIYGSERMANVTKEDSYGPNSVVFVSLEGRTKRTPPQELFDENVALKPEYESIAVAVKQGAQFITDSAHDLINISELSDTRIGDRQLAQYLYANGYKARPHKGALLWHKTDATDMTDVGFETMLDSAAEQELDKKTTPIEFSESSQVQRKGKDATTREQRLRQLSIDNKSLFDALTGTTIADVHYDKDGNLIPLYGNEKYTYTTYAPIQIEAADTSKAAWLKLNNILARYFKVPMVRAGSLTPEEMADYVPFGTLPSKDLANASLERGYVHKADFEFLVKEVVKIKKKAAKSNGKTRIKMLPVVPALSPTEIALRKRKSLTDMALAKKLSDSPKQTVKSLETLILAGFKGAPDVQKMAKLLISKVDPNSRVLFINDVRHTGPSLQAHLETMLKTQGVTLSNVSATATQIMSELATQPPAMRLPDGTILIFQKGLKQAEAASPHHDVLAEVLMHEIDHNAVLDALVQDFNKPKDSLNLQVFKGLYADVMRKAHDATTPAAIREILANIANAEVDGKVSAQSLAELSAYGKSHPDMVAWLKTENLLDNARKLNQEQYSVFHKLLRIAAKMLGISVTKQGINNYALLTGLTSKYIGENRNPTRKGAKGYSDIDTDLLRTSVRDMHNQSKRELDKLAELSQGVKERLFNTLLEAAKAIDGTLTSTERADDLIALEKRLQTVAGSIAKEGNAELTSTNKDAIEGVLPSTTNAVRDALYGSLLTELQTGLNSNTAAKEHREKAKAINDAWANLSKAVNKNGTLLSDVIIKFTTAANIEMEANRKGEEEAAKSNKKFDSKYEAQYNLTVAKAAQKAIAEGKSTTADGTITLNQEADMPLMLRDSTTGRTPVELPLTEDTTMMIFDMLEGTSDKHVDTQEYKDHIRRFMETIIPSIRTMKANILGVQEDSNEQAVQDAIEEGFTLQLDVSNDVGVINEGSTEGENVRVTIGTFAKSDRLEMSPQQLLAHELGHMFLLGLNKSSQPYRNIGKLYTHALKHLKPEHFLANIATPTLEEIAEADARFNHTMHNSTPGRVQYDTYLGTNAQGALYNADPVEEFAVMALTNPELITALVAMDKTVAEKSTTDMSTSEHMHHWIGKAFELIDKELADGDIANDDFMMRQAEALYGIEGKSRQQAYIEADPFSEGIDVVSDWAKKHLKSVTGFNAIAQLNDNGSFDVYKKSLRKWVSESSIARSELIRDIGMELYNARNGVREIIRLMGKSTKAVEQQTQLLKESMAQGFNEVFPTFNLNVKTAITKAVLRTGAYHLLEKYSPIEILDFIASSDVRKARIATIKTELQQSDVAAGAARYVSLAAEDLGYNLATGDNLYEFAGYTNALQIVDMWGATEVSGVKDRDASLALITELSTLYALEYSNQSDLVSIGALFNTENYSANDLELILQTHKESSVLSANLTFKGNEHFMGHAYTREEFGEIQSRMIGTLADEERLSNLGYTRAEKVKHDPSYKVPGDQYYYVNPNTALDHYVTGAISISSPDSAGSDLFTIKDEYTDVDKLNLTRGFEGMRRRKEDLRIRAYVGQAPKLPGDVRGTIATPKYNATGKIVGFRYIANSKTKDTEMKRDNDFSNILGATFASIHRRVQTDLINDEVVTHMHEKFLRDFQDYPNEFIVVGPDVANAAHKEAWNLLPPLAQAKAEELWGVKAMVMPFNDFQLVHGFRKFTPSQLKHSNEPTPNAIRKVMQLTNNTANVLFNNRVVNTAIPYWQDMIRSAKDFMVIKSGVVTGANVVSNMVLLWWSGVDPRQAARDHVEAYNYAMAYMINAKEDATISTKLLSRALEPQQRRALETRRSVLRNEQYHNPVRSMMEAGLYTSIVDDVEVGEQVTRTKQGFDELLAPITEKLPDAVIGASNFVFMSHDTPMYQVFRDTAQLSDFAARYSLHKYNMRNGQMTEAESFEDVRMSFINYDIPSHKGLQFVNDMGLMGFTKYLLGIQHVIIKRFGEKPGRLIITSLLTNFLGLPIATPLDAAMTPDAIANRLYDIGDWAGMATEGAPMQMIAGAFGFVSGD